MLAMRGKMRGWSVEARFWACVSPEPNTGCWLWTGAFRRDSDKRGYGRITISDAAYPAHRLSLELATGERPPPSIFACHKCDNPWCVNPGHLFWGTPADNVHDMNRKGRTVSCPGDLNGARKHREAVRRGERHYKTKFTREQVEQIKARRAAGERLKALAAEYGVAESCISRIANGVRWAAPEAA
jgi:hypothetical protein